MTKRMLLLLLLLLLAPALALHAAEKKTGKKKNAAPGRWPVKKAQVWGAKQPWLVGANFIPSTAINELEMWQAATFDPATIDRELGWAEGLGMNTVRTFLHDRAWEADKDGFKKRIGEFLAIAQKHHIRPLLVLFDDCWNEGAKPGPQPTPKPGVHNSGWLQAPGIAIVNDPSQWGRLEAYAKDIVGTFAKDDRILLWDVYNEPGNSKNEGKSLPFLKKVFEWARAAKPSQPLSAGTWNAAPGFKELNAFQLANSDVITFHNYVSAEELKAEIAKLKKLGRPVICTEYMARTNGSKFQTHLPVFKAEGVGAINWGLVAGKTNTIFSWKQVGPLPEPPVLFHDIFRKDGAPYDPEEVKVIRELTGNAAKK
jgi:endo-1,4-beta-mannosidase